MGQADEHGLELAGGQEDALGEHGVEEFGVGGGVAGGGLIEIGHAVAGFDEERGDMEPTR